MMGLIGMGNNPMVGATMGDYVFVGCSSLSINCEASAKPEGWEEFWNGFDRPVTRDYKE